MFNIAIEQFDYTMPTLKNQLKKLQNPNTHPFFQAY